MARALPLPLPLLLLTLLVQGLRAAEIAPREINLNSLTCDSLRHDAEPLHGCQLSLVTDREQQITCKMLVKYRDSDGNVVAQPKMMLNTMTFRLIEKNKIDGDYFFCASFASVQLQIRNKELAENHTVGDLPSAFISFLNFFTDDSYARFNFTKKVPVAAIYLTQKCRDLFGSDLRQDCIEKVTFLKEIKHGSFKLKFINDEFWSFMKRRYIEDLGGEMTHLSLTSSGVLSAVPIDFLTSLISNDLHMRELTLAKMKVVDLRGPIIHMETLHVLRLHDASISQLTEATLRDVPNLLELDMSGNELEQLPPVLPSNMTALNVSRNKLTNVSSTLPAMLLSLNVSHNHIQRLPERLPSGLQLLDAAHNALTALPSALPPALRILRLSHNRLLALPDDLPSSLAVLQVSHNLLQSLDSQLLVPLQELQLLDASYNALTRLEDVWLSHHMQLLNVSHNQLSHLSLQGPGNVTHIDASYNAIESWKGRTSYMSLAGNPRSPLGLTWTRSDDMSPVIDLGDNLLLNCDACSPDSDVALQLRRWMLRQQDNSSLGGPRVVRPQQPVCAGPLEYAGQLLVQQDSLEDRSGCPGSPRYIAQFVLLLISVLAVIGALVALCYFRRYEITYVLHLMKMRRERVAAERRSSSSYKYDAFVCYSSADRAWVIGHLLPKMEHSGDSPAEPPLRLCLHERDFPLGSFIADNIISSMKNSRSTVVVLSQAFVESQWCRWELELASVKVHHLVLLELERLERSRLPRHLRYLMDTRTYLEWPQQARLEPAMWKRLRAALASPVPDPVPSSQAETNVDAEQLQDAGQLCRVVAAKDADKS